MGENKSDIAGWWLYGPWYYFSIGFIDEIKTKQKWKIIRFLLSIVGFIWFAILVPITFISIIILSCIDGWKNL